MKTGKPIQQRKIFAHCAKRLLKLLTGIALCWATAMPLPSAASGDDATSPEADWAAPSPDGTALAYVVSAPGKRSAVWLASRSGSQPRLLLDWPEASQTEPDWSPDGKYLVFASNRDSRGYNIWRVGPDGTNPVQLTTGAGNHQPRYSPDGQTILFTSGRTGKDELWTMAADGSNQRLLLEQSLLVSDPSWSPDGARIVFTGCKLPPPGRALNKGVCRLFTYDRGAATVNPLTNGNFQDWSGDWSMNGIVFWSTRGSSPGLWTVSPDGSTLHQITFNALELHPKWDHYNHTIIVARDDEIWSVDLTGKATQLTHVSSTNQPPVANAGVDRTVECAAPLGTEVTLDGTASYDPDGDPLTFNWSGDFGVLSGALATARLHPDRNAVTLSVDDGKGGQSSAQITIEVVDTTRPAAT